MEDAGKGLILVALPPEVNVTDLVPTSGPTGRSSLHLVTEGLEVRCEKCRVEVSQGAIRLLVLA